MSIVVIGAQTTRVPSEMVTDNPVLVRCIGWTVYRFVTNVLPTEVEPRYLDAQLGAV